MGCCSDEARAQKKHLWFGHAWDYLKNVYTDDRGNSILSNVYFWLNILGQAIPFFGPFCGSLFMVIAYGKYQTSMVKKFILGICLVMYPIQSLVTVGLSQFVPFIGTLDFFYFVLRIATHANLWATYVRRVRPYPTVSDARLGSGDSYNLLQDIPARAVFILSLPFYVGPVLLYLVYGPYILFTSCKKQDGRGKMGFMDFLTFVMGFPVVLMFYHLVLISIITPIFQILAHSLCLLWVLSVFAKVEYYNGDVYQPEEHNITSAKAQNVRMVAPITSDNLDPGQAFINQLFADHQL